MTALPEQAEQYANDVADTAHGQHLLETLLQRAYMAGALAALEQQVAEGEELDKYRRGDGKREWSDACTWLYPGDRVVVLRA